MSWLSRLFDSVDCGSNKDIEMHQLSMESQMKIASTACGMIKGDVEKFLDDEILSKSIAMAVDEIVSDRLSVDCEALVDVETRSDVTVITIKNNWIK